MKITVLLPNTETVIGYKTKNKCFLDMSENKNKQVLKMLES